MAWRHRINFLAVLLLAVAGPAWAQTEPRIEAGGGLHAAEQVDAPKTWLEVSQAGLRAAEEGLLQEAERAFREALRLSEGFAGDDRRRATSINNLAYILHAQGQYVAAEPRYLESLAMRERVLGKDHADVAQSCNNLAELYRALGR